MEEVLLNTVVDNPSMTSRAVERAFGVSHVTVLKILLLQKVQAMTLGNYLQLPTLTIGTRSRLQPINQ